MGQIETLERELRDLARTAAVASHRGWISEWENRFDAYKLEVRRAFVLNPDIGVRVEVKLLLGIEVLNDVLIGMEEGELDDRLFEWLFPDLIQRMKRKE